MTNVTPEEKERKRQKILRLNLGSLPRWFRRMRPAKKHSHAAENARRVRQMAALWDHLPGCKLGPDSCGWVLIAEERESEVA